MGMVSEKVTVVAVFLGTRTMKGNPVFFLAKPGPEIIKVKVTGLVSGNSAQFGDKMTFIFQNCEQKFSQFETSFHEAEAVAISAVPSGALKDKAA